MNEQWKMVPVEPTEEMIYWIATGAHRGDSGKEIWSEALAYAPVPPDGGEVQDSAKMEFDKLSHAHVLAICRGAAASCTEQHSYMQGAKTDSKNWFPHKWVIDAIRNLIGINQSTCLTLRDDTTRLQSEVSALQQRLNIADQRVSDLTAERDGLLEASQSMDHMISTIDKAVGDETGLMWQKIQRAFLVEIPQLQSELTKARECISELERGLKFYADGDHLLLADPDAWDTCSGEPINFLHDEAGTASVEDGSIAKQFLTHQSAPATKGGNDVD